MLDVMWRQDNGHIKTFARTIYIIHSLHTLPIYASQAIEFLDAQELIVIHRWSQIYM